MSPGNAASDGRIFITGVVDQRTWNTCGMMTNSEKVKNSEGNLYRSNLFTKNLIWTTFEAKLVLCGGKPASSRIDHSTAVCDGPITRPEESSECGVSECNLETSTTRRPRPARAVEP